MTKAKAKNAAKTKELSATNVGTAKAQAKAVAEEWAKMFPPDTEVAIVMENGTREIAVIGGEPKLDAELEIVCPVVLDPDDAQMEIFPATRIRARAIERKKTTNPLRVRLNDVEKIAAGDLIADTVQKIATLESNLASVKKQIQAQIQAATSELEAKSELIRNGYEVRSVECELILDFDLGRATEVRKDNGETIDSRDLRLDERERELSLFPAMHSQAQEDEADAQDPQGGLNLDGAGEGEGGTPADDPDAPRPQEVQDAIALLRETKRATTTGIQRKLQVGFSRACRIMDVLQERGIVGAPDPDGGARQILVDLDTLDMGGEEG